MPHEIWRVVARPMRWKPQMYRPRRVAELGGMPLILMSLVACNPEDRLKVGMTESEVLRIMGRPTRVIDGPSEVKQELQREYACAAAASRELVYNRGRDREVQVRVGFDAKGTVRCVLES